jgi:HK97 family phage portal protein
MNLFGFHIGRERRGASPETETVKVSAENFLAFFGQGGVSLPAVTIESALTVPAVWAAVSFLSRTLAALPLHAWRTSRKGPVRVTTGVGALVDGSPNAAMDSFKFRQWFWQQVFTGGRGLAWIERSGRDPVALWPIDPARATVLRAAGRTTYQVDGKVYDAAEVIDVAFMLKADGLGHWGPIVRGAKAIQLAVAMNDYGSTFFAGGGVPPLALTGPMPSGSEAMKRMLADVRRAIDEAKQAEKPLFPIPPGYELKPVGFDPEKGQMTDARRFQVEEIARLYQLPPVFLQDLTRATFSNAEQQDLHLVKHLIGQWAQALEGEMNLKLFGGQAGRYVEHNLDGLLRGDFKTRMEGMAKAIQTAIRTPNECRRLEGLPDMPKGDTLLIQGATVPLGTQPTDNGGANDPDSTGDEQGA